MIIRPNDAHKYKCCQMDKPCDGKECMAWVIYGEFKKDGDGNFVDVDKDFGYCGLIK